MKIVLTGSLGHISRPLADTLVQQGHAITIISSNADRTTDIKALGATAAIGHAADIDFLTATFTGADAVYCMVPPNFAAPDQLAYYDRIAESYAAAIRQSGVQRVLYLSSYGSHLPGGTGFITGSYRGEQLLGSIPGIALTHIRPGYFYYNLLGFVGMIKAAGFIGSVYGGEDKLAMVAPADIAAAIAEEIVVTDNPVPYRYVASDDHTCNEVAQVLGAAIGIPHLEWKVLPAEQVLQSLINHGIPEDAARNLVELGQATHSGILREDYEQHPPVLGNVKLEDFAKEFAKAYAGSK